MRNTVEPERELTLEGFDGNLHRSPQLLCPLLNLSLVSSSRSCLPFTRIRATSRSIRSAIWNGYGRGITVDTVTVISRRLIRHRIKSGSIEGGRERKGQVGMSPLMNGGCHFLCMPTEMEKEGEGENSWGMVGQLGQSEAYLRVDTIRSILLIGRLDRSAGAVSFLKRETD